MSDQKTIDIETVQSPPQQGGQSMGLQVSQAGAVGRAMSVDELTANLAFIRDVMKNVMKEGTDYGKIPGTGDKPGLFQPGAQKLLMTFQLTDHVKKEVLREYPNMHREYEFTVTVRSQTGREWDGVGTCSTLESKYRYRGGTRKCPACGKATILSAKKGPPGFFCWAKKGGCGEKFDINDPRITHQSTTQSENPDPADQWNTVRKMAFKRALVAAAINATNTSELWSQDLEDLKGNQAAHETDPGEEASQTPPGPRRGGQTQAGKPAAAPRPSPAPGPTQKTVPLADEQTRGKMLRQFEDLPLLGEFFVKIGWLLPKGETVQDLPLQFVPITKRQADTLKNCFENFKNGGDAVAPYKANPHRTTAPAPTSKAAEPTKPTVSRDLEWWRTIIVPIPPKGTRRDDYLKQPDTVGSLYEDRHDPETARRLFGFISHFQPSKTWTGGDGQVHQRSDTEIKVEETFREALDGCADFHEKHGQDTEPPAEPDQDVPF